MKTSLIAAVVAAMLTVYSDALVISKGSAHALPGPSSFFTHDADSDEYVVKVVDADVVPELDNGKLGPSSPTRSLVQTEQKHGEGADADGEEVVRVVEADVVDDSAHATFSINGTSHAKSNASAKVRDRVENANDLSVASESDHAKTINAAKVHDPVKNAISKVASKSEQDDNDDEVDSGADVAQGPVKPHASVVQVAPPKAIISAVAPSSKVVPALSMAVKKRRSSRPDQRAESLDSESTEDAMKQKQAVQASDEVEAESSAAELPPDADIKKTVKKDCDRVDGNEFNEEGC